MDQQIDGLVDARLGGHMDMWVDGCMNGGWMNKGRSGARMVVNL